MFLKPKRVTILSAECLGQISDNEYKFQFKCKGGTYIRSLARDIGIKCGTLGVMSALDRRMAGVFDYANGISVEELRNSDDVEEYIIKADTVVDFTKLLLTNEQATKILNGVYPDYGIKDGIYRVYNENDFWGVGVAENGSVKIKAYVR